MKILGLIFLVIIIVLQYRIWMGDNGAPKIENLQQQILEQKAQNKLLVKQNKILKDEIHALRNNPELLEEVAREKLGLIKPDETFFRIIPKQDKSTDNN